MEMGELLRTAAAWNHGTVQIVQFVAVILVFLAPLIGAQVFILGRPRTTTRCQFYFTCKCVILAIACVLGLGSIALGILMLQHQGVGLRVVGLGVGFFIAGWSALKAPQCVPDSGVD
ncbi:MAG: hypothetical protein R3B68_03035 [Phycisphaerales bacterium]